MPKPVILLSVPGLRARDLPSMPRLEELVRSGDRAELSPSFPAVTCPVQAAMTTGRTPREHGVIANGFYYRDRREVEMWTAWNECITAPQIWDVLHQRDRNIASAVWFPMHSKGCGADYVCTPAPIHNPDGSESLWCFTQPTELYGTLRDTLGHFPLQHFWGPAANIKSNDWIADSAVYAADQFRPDFFYIYLTHLDCPAQKFGPDSPQALAALGELDAVIGRLSAGFHEAYAGRQPLWLVAGEYTIVPVDHVAYPNRVLREAGLLAVREEEDGEHLDLAGSRAWAMVDHQLAHVFVADGDEAVIRRVADLFTHHEGIAEVLIGPRRDKYDVAHERSGEVVLISAPHSWQAYYWWLDDALAPGFARTVDIHRKPGYDPAEMIFDPATKAITLDATLVRGSHGAPTHDASQRTILLTSQPGILPAEKMRDADVFDLVLGQFGG